MYRFPDHRRDGSGATMTSGRSRRTSRVTFRRVSSVTSSIPSTSPRNVTLFTPSTSAAARCSRSRMGRSSSRVAPGSLEPAESVGDDHVVDLATLAGPRGDRAAAHELGVVGVGEQDERAGEGHGGQRIAWSRYRKPRTSPGLLRPVDTSRYAHVEGDGRIPHARIVAWFALTSLIVFVVIGAFITTFRARDVRAREERAAASRAELVANEAIGPALEASDFSGPDERRSLRSDRGSGADDPRQADRGILRVKLWAPTERSCSPTIRRRSA